MSHKKILVFHPDINVHKTNNEYTIKVYNILRKSYDIKSFEWFLKHPYDKRITGLYLNWYENTVWKNKIFIQKFIYFLKMIAIRWAHFRKLKIAYVVHNKKPHSVKKDSIIYKKVVKRFMEKALNISDYIVELCKHTEIYLASEFRIDNLREKIREVPHGKYSIFACDVNSLRKKYNIGERELVFSFVGGMDEYKNIDIIIEAFYRSGVTAKLLLVGKCKNEYKLYLESLIHDESIICNFSFISDEELSGIIQASDAIVLPYENTSINSGIMINAFSNGTTVIGTNIGMMKDYPGELVYGYEYVNREDHVAVLSHKMRLADRDNRIERLKEKGRRLRQNVEKNNSWDDVEKVLINLFK